MAEVTLSAGSGSDLSVEGCTCDTLQGVEKLYSSVPEIDAIEDMHVTEPEAVEAARKLSQLQSQLKEDYTDALEASVSVPPSYCHLQRLYSYQTSPWNSVQYGNVTHPSRFQCLV